MPLFDHPDGPIEYRLIDGDPALSPLVFLHEGLGCVAMWSRFPDMVAGAAGRRTLVYSRQGHGASAAQATSRSTQYLHDEAEHGLPALLDHFEMPCPVLVGHSDGATIALLYAARRRTAGVVAIAPHVFVESETLEGVEAATREYEHGALAARLSLFHDDPDTVFRSWSEIWRSVEFADWNIVNDLSDICCPALLIQGTNDRYGTARQLDAITRTTSGRIDRFDVDDCGHAPHLEHAVVVASRVDAFLASL